jgi:hypothetical protein
MTIGIGFHSVDGVVMGSDRQMTAQGSHKFPEKKLFEDVRDDRILVMIGGNELGLAKELWWKLLEYPISDYESYGQALTTILDNMGTLVHGTAFGDFMRIGDKDRRVLVGVSGQRNLPDYG